MGASKLKIFGGRRLGPEPAASPPSHAQAEKMSIGSCNAPRSESLRLQLHGTPAGLFALRHDAVLLFAVTGC
jgi:hypothetical protein